MAVKRRTLQPHVVRKKDKWGDDRKEQINLGQGTGEYAEMVRDHRGVEEESFVKDSPVPEAGEDRRPDDAQVVRAEPEHVAQFAGEIRQAADAQRGKAADVEQMKYRRQMSKATQVPELRREAVAAAAETPDKADDKRAASIRDVSDIPDVYDDGVESDEFLPRGIRRVLGE